MKNKKARTVTTAQLRLQAEKILLEKESALPENLEALTPEEIQRTLHELRVHQIELEMQNEELRRTQVELETTRSHYFELYDLAPIGYCTISEHGLILQANLTAATLLGVSRERLTTQLFSRFILKKDQDIFYHHRKQVIKSGEPQSCELRMVNKDGSQFWAHLESTSAQDVDGATVLRVVLSDITEIKQAEAALDAANIALEEALSHERELSLTDVLTGVSNRRHLFECAEHEVEVASRYQQPLSVIMFDLDRFKNVNDSFGHAVGDLMLQRVTQAACEELRSVDMIGRYGGEEFVILMPMTKAEQAYPLAERIRTKVEKIRISTELGDATATLSIGIIEMDHAVKIETADSLIRRADAAMYSAKHAGRNRTVIGQKEMTNHAG
jgi:diguanylate cyclase (GGDEF)-like protein/PAS domain S-box-containing protein